MTSMQAQPEHVVRLFEAAAVRAPHERLAFLREACADDPELRHHIEAMLTEADGEILIDHPVADTIAALLGTEDTVTPGTRFGPYAIESLLGAGGMGEVYRATDTTLGRQVAIKLLPSEVAADPERIARFRREAKILASLNHSNIGAIYGVEAAAERADVLGLVLELVAGPTLAEQLSSGPLPIDEALAVARQVADALDAAHQQGIVHRDLKPGNIKVRDDGVVKVLDFGLARLDHAHASDSSSPHVLAESPTITTPAMTAVGILLGTAAYMSPEQAKGRPADKRSDIWAFGCVLYEMLTGTRAFGGDDVADTLAAVLRGEPDYSLLPRETPDAIRALIRGCLTRDRHRRLGDLAAVRFVFDNLGTLAPAAVATTTPRRRVNWRTAAIVVTAALALAALIGIAARSFIRTPTAAITRYSIDANAAAAPDIDLIARDLTVLPNGAVVYKGFASQSTQRLFLRARDQIQPAVLLTTGAPTPRGPFSSPDGKRIGFLDLGPGGPELKIVPVEGGPAISVCPLDNTPSAGATWGDDDTIIFATGNLSTGLYRVSANGGHPEVLTKPDRARRERDHVWPHFLPRGRAVLFTITPAADTEEPRLAVLDLSTGRTKSLNLPGSQAHYTASGHLVYLAGATLFAVPFDLDRLEVRGTPTPLPIRVATTSSGTAEFDIGRDGTLAYVPAGATNATAPRTLVWVDRHGREEPIRGAGPRAYMHPRLSPDGSQLAVTIADQDSRIYVWDFAREHLTRVTFEPGFQGVPVWIDRRTVAYTSILVSGVIGRLYRRAVDGTGNAEAIASADPAPPGLVPSSVYGGTLLAWTIMGSSDVLKLTLNDRSLTSWYQTPYTERNAEISPDGRWVAYEAANPGQAAQFNIYVRPFAHPDDRLVEISTSGGRQPAWNRNGTELFFMGSDGTLYSVGFNPETGVAETPLPALPSPYYQGTIAGMFAARMYDISKDGRLLMLKEAESDRSPSRASIIVTQNWLEELQRLVPAR